MSLISPAAEPFHAESVNRSEYQYRQSERQKPIRPKNEIEASSGPFGGESSTRDAFRAWEPQAMYRHQRPAYQKPEGTMELSTTYGNQFVHAKAYFRLPPIRPESHHRKLNHEPQEFAISTEQADSFPAYRRAQLANAKQPSFRPARSYQAPEVPFDGRSSYSGQFTAAAGGSPLERVRPVKHEDQLTLSREAMESRGNSTSSSYGSGVLIVGTVARRQPIIPRGELAITGGGPFQDVTTQRGDFAPLQGPQQLKRKPIRPVGELQLASGEPFMARTLAQEDFGAKSMTGGRPAPIKPRGELELSREPMTVETTSRDVYTPKTRDEPPPTRRRQPQQVQ